MRWDSQLIAQTSDESTLPFAGGTAVVRTFKTPEFAGMSFYEIRAKSIINHVPGDRFGFNWTINPYRGCSHSCSYCQAPDTPILMADERTKPIADLEIGERIVGTMFDGKHRRCVSTEVRDQWETIRRAYRITLEDGTELIASSDHLYLTDRGWMPATTGARLTGLSRAREGQRSVATLERTLEGTAVETALRVESVEDLGYETLMYDITTGTGDFIANGVVSHNCFARPTHTYLDFNSGDDFENKIVVKVNAVELLHKELRKKSWGGELIAMGTNTDPYQRAEGHYKLMRGILQELNAVRNPYSILTKGTLIQRDIDLLQEGAEVTDVSTNFSVGTVDEKVWRESEPGTPHPMKRLEVVRKLNESGIPCGVLMAPILPGISDSMEQLEATVRAAAEAGATHITPIVLHLRPGVKEEFIPWLEATYPSLLQTYETIYKRSNGPKAVREPLVAAVGNLKRKYKVNTEFKPARSQKKAAAPERDEQLSFDLDLNNGRKAPKWVKGNL